MSRQAADKVALSHSLFNLAVLLIAQPERLTEARQLAEESLELCKTMDAGASEIWKSYSILANIADKEGRPEQAAEYRRLARDATRAFAGTAYEMRRFMPLILGACLAIQDPGQAKEFESVLSAMEEHGRTNLVGAIRWILAGERNRDALCDKLDLQEAMIVETILEALENPAILQALLPAKEATSA